MRASRVLAARRQYHAQAPQRAQALAATRARRDLEKVARQVERLTEEAS